MSDLLKKAAEKSLKKKAAFGEDVDLEKFGRQGGDWAYDEKYQSFDDDEKDHLLRAGVELTDEGHAGTFFQADRRIMHCKTSQPGLEVLPIKEALERYNGLPEYYWKLVAVDARSEEHTSELQSHC